MDEMRKHVPNSQVIFLGDAYDDFCPVCDKPVTSICRCMAAHRWCENNHQWRRNSDGKAVIEKGDKKAWQQ